MTTSGTERRVVVRGTEVVGCGAGVVAVARGAAGAEVRGAGAVVVGRGAVVVRRAAGAGAAGCWTRGGLGFGVGGFWGASSAAKAMGRGQASVSKSASVSSRLSMTSPLASGTDAVGGCTVVAGVWEPQAVSAPSVIAPTARQDRAVLRRMTNPFCRGTSLITWQSPQLSCCVYTSSHKVSHNGDNLS